MFDLPPTEETLARALFLTTAGLLWVVVLVRVIGLRSFSKMTAFDFVATVAMGSLLATAAAAESWQTFAQVLLAMTALLLAQASLALLRRKSERLRHIICNTPVLLIENGQFAKRPCG